MGLLELLEKPEWFSYAKCLGVGPGKFYSEASNGDVQRSKKICKGLDGNPPCPALEECLVYALRNDERHGVWGGTSERERRRMKRRPLP